MFIVVGGFLVVVDISKFVGEVFVGSLLGICRGSCIIGNKFLWIFFLLILLSFRVLLRKGSVVNESEFEEVVSKVNWFL